MLGSRPVVLVADELDPSALEDLARSAEVVNASGSPDLISATLPRAEGLIVRSRTKVTKELLALAGPLRVIGRAGVGVDNIDMTEVTRRRIPVVNAPAAATASVAELTVGLLVAVARDFGSQMVAVKSGTWKKAGNGLELFGRTVGFVGYGRIAREVAVRLRAFGMRTQAYDPFLSSTGDGTPLVPLTELLKTSDVVSVHSPLTPETHHLVGAEQLAQMRPGAILLNAARGGLVDESALLAALESGRLAGAGLDVFEVEPPREPRLLAHPKVVATPHIGASTREAQARAGATTVAQVLKVLRGETPEFCVNPEVWKR
jgi:D-3-phosphoglycerate dehydrogenase